MNLLDPQERSALAGEYVLGTLSEHEHKVFSLALARDAALQAEVAHWQDRLLGLASQAAPADPSPVLWPRIADSLAQRPLPTALTSTPNAPPIAASPQPQRRPLPLAQRLGFWQSLTAAAVLASLVLAVVLSLHLPGAEVAAQQYVAVLQSPDKTAVGWLVEARSGGSIRLLPLASAEPVPAGRALQFWTKGEQDVGPTSLGLVKPGVVAELPASRIPKLGDRQLFEITLEPEAGSPENRPTGPVLFIGLAVKA